MIQQKARSLAWLVETKPNSGFIELISRISWIVCLLCHNCSERMFLSILISLASRRLPATLGAEEKEASAGLKVQSVMGGLEGEHIAKIMFAFVSPLG